MLQFFKRWFGGATAYQPGTGRIVQVHPTASSGVNINETTAMTIPALFHAMRFYGQTLGSVKWNLIQHSPDNRGETIARDHPVHALLHHEPNEFQNPSEFRELLIHWGLIYGNGIAYIERNGNFRPTALYPLLPDRTRPKLNEQGQLTYETVVNGKIVTLDPYEVFHFKGFSGSVISGYPLVQLMRDTLGLSKAEEEFYAKFFGTGCNMGGVVTMPGKMSLTAQQNIKDSMDREYGGLGNAFRTLFLEEGMKYERTGVAPDQAQAVENRQFSIQDMARVVGLAPQYLFELSRSTNNNIEHMGIELINFSLGPIANRLDEEANRKLLYEKEKGGYFCRLDLGPLKTGDAQSQATVDKTNFDMLALTPNERRARIGLNPIEGGDQLFLNTAYLPLDIAIKKALTPAPVPGMPPASPDATPDDGDDETSDETTNTDPPSNPNAGVKDPDGEPGPDVPSNLIDADIDRSAVVAPVVRDAIERIIRREQKAVENASKKYAGDSAALTRWLDKWESDERSHIAEVLEPVRQTCAALGLQWRDNFAAEFLRDWGGHADPWGRDRIEKAVSDLISKKVGN